MFVSIASDVLRRTIYAVIVRFLGTTNKKKRGGIHYELSSLGVAVRGRTFATNSTRLGVVPLQITHSSRDFIHNLSNS